MITVIIVGMVVGSLVGIAYNVLIFNELTNKQAFTLAHLRNVLIFMGIGAIIGAATLSELFHILP